jgi:hypothetical protein
MDRSSAPYLVLLFMVAGCSASLRVEEFDKRQPWIYSGSEDALYGDPDGARLGSVRSGDTLQVVASVVNEDTGELVYYLVDRNGSRARVRAPLLRRDPPPPATRVDTTGGDTLAQTIFTDGKGLRYYIDPEGNKVYVKKRLESGKQTSKGKRPRKKKRK